MPSRSGHTLPEEESSAETAAAAEQRTSEEKQALAIGLLCKHPDWPKSKIAEVVGVDRRTLYNWPVFQTAWRNTKAKDTAGIARGSKDKLSRTVEAYSPVTKCVPAAMSPPRSTPGKDYCRECYLEVVLEDQDDDKRKDDEGGAGRSKLRVKRD